MCSRRERDIHDCARSKWCACIGNGRTLPPRLRPSRQKHKPNTLCTSHGYGATAIHRADVVEALYRGLPPAAAEKVFTNKKLASIRTHGAGVEVTCADGTLYQGSIVVGADGVHSTTRHLMRSAALKEDPSRRDWDAEEPFPAAYQLLFGAFPTPSVPGQGYDVQAKDKAIMYLSGHKRSWIFLYKKLPKPTSERLRYTDEDIQAVAAEFAEFPLTEGVKVKDVWPTMLGAGLTNLGEGIAKHWSLGRTVLVGDACHKFTTHLGLGFNNGVQDVVVLANMLRKAVRQGGGSPDTATIRGVFEAYEALRKSPACSLVADAANSGHETRMHAWANTAYYLISRWLAVPKFVEDLVMRSVITPELRKAQVLDYVAMKEPMKGKVSWLYPMGA